VTQARKAVVPGGCGLTGSACMRALARDGFAVTGIGRSWRSAQTSEASGRWVIRDIAAIFPDEWRSILRDAEVVVNAAGALQDGAADDLEAIHMRAVERLVAGCAGVPLRIVQISAAGVSAQASTAFFRTKAKGDDLLRFGMQNLSFCARHLSCRPRPTAAPHYCAPSRPVPSSCQSSFTGRRFRRCM
jgi:uncharacterized protein YbjT (DUF2867 family)